MSRKLKNNADKYIIFTPGRTKSHMILAYLRCHGYHTINLHPPRDTWHSLDHESIYHREKNIVIHYHGITFVPDQTENYTVILNHRKDIFALYCSHALARKTGYYTSYPVYDEKLAVKIDIADAVMNCKYAYDYFLNVQKNVLDGRPWRKIVKIDYEDIGDTHDNLFKLLPLPAKNSTWPSLHDAEKSPYRPEKHIWHYRFMRNQFEKRFYKSYGIRL